MSYPNNPPVPASITVDTTASINSGLVGFWPLTDGTGTTATDLVGSNNGTLDTTVSFSNGELGNNAEFNPDGVNDGIATSYSPNGLSAFSVSAWVRSDGDSLGTTYGKVASSDHGGGIDFMVQKSTGQPRVYAGSGLSVPNVNPPANKWNHVAATWASGGSPKIYVNGEEVTYATQTTYTGSLSTSNSIMIGDNSAVSRPIEGGIQNVRIYNRALSATEVAELYSVPWTGTDYVAQNLTPDTPIAMGVDPNHSLSSGLVGYWPLSDGSGTTAKDISGSAATLTKNGTITYEVSPLGTTALLDGNSGTLFDGGSSLLASPTGITVSAWVNLDAYDSGTGHGIVSRWGGGANQFLLYYPANGTAMRFFVTNSGTNYIAQSTRVPSDFVGRFVNFVGTWDGTDVKLYIDGFEDATIAGPASVNAGGSTNIDVGNYGAGNHALDGRIQNVRIYNRALSAAEVEALYNEPWAGVVTAKSAPPQYITVDTADSINTGLLGFWPLSDGDTTAVDLSGNANNGTQSGGVSWTADDKGVSASFDGVDDYIDCTAISQGTAGSFTVSAWCNPDTSSKDQRFVSKWTIGAGGTQPDLFNLWYDIGGANVGYTFAIKDASGTANIVGVNSLSGAVGEWSHVVGVYDASTPSIAIYVDGVLVDSGSATSPVHWNPNDSQSPFRIGSVNAERCDGLAQNCRFYNRALSAAEVSRLYQDPWAGTDRAIEPSPTAKDLDTSSSLTTNLVGWWPLTEFGPQDTLAYDISGSGNHGVASGGVQRQFTDTVRAATFDGVDDKFGMGSPIYTHGAVTASAWFRWGGSTTFNSILGNYISSSSNDKLYVQYRHDTTTLRAYLGSVNSQVVAATVTLTGWHHIAVTWDLSTAKLYLDGVEIDSVAYSSTSGTQSTSDFTIGDRSNDGTLHAGGNIQNVRVYSRALSAAEVQTLYDDPWVGLATDSLVYAYYSAAFLQRLG